VRYLCAEVNIPVLSWVWRQYRAAFEGLSQEAWVLATVMFINRAGTMVLPFLGLYLREGLGFSLADTGWIMAFYGVGSMVGALAGGALSDRWGSYQVQRTALFVGSVLFFLLSFLTEFWSLAFGVFILTAVADMVRPANSSAVFEYAKEGNVTRAFSLNRMAINLGFSVGPAAAGIIAAWSYQGLFWADAATCAAAGFLFVGFFHKRRPRRAPEKAKGGKSPYRDRGALAFSVLVLLFAVAFFQLVSTMPLYYRDVFNLGEEQIGLLLGFNGLLIVAVEMVFVNWAQNRIAPRHAIAIGVLVMALAFASLNWATGLTGLYASMLVLSVSEILAMPFMISWITLRAGDESRGRYLGLYAATYALGHIMAPLIGTYVIEHFGYTHLYYGVALLSLGTAFGFSQLPPAIARR
jgi:predicted MFS family arabinose efflux permease